MPISVTCPACNKTLKAPDKLAGKTAKCPGCGGPVVIPAAEVYDAEPLEPEPSYEAPAPASPGWQQEDLADFLSPTAGGAAPEADGGDGGEGAPRKPCPACGEMIVAKAAKCRFCGEIFDPALSGAAKKKSKGGDDDDLTAGEWVLAILCSGIGCIMGIIWMVQGKKKGTKMLVVSLIASAVGGLVRVLLTMSEHGHR